MIEDLEAALTAGMRSAGKDQIIVEVALQLQLQPEKVKVLLRKLCLFLQKKIYKSLILIHFKNERKCDFIHCIRLLYALENTKLANNT